MSRRRISTTALRKLETTRGVLESTSSTSTTPSKEQLLAKLMRPEENAGQLQHQIPPPSQQRVHAPEKSLSMAETRLRGAQQRLRDRISGALPFPTCSITPQHREAVLRSDLSEIASARLMLKFVMISLEYERNRVREAEAEDPDASP